MRPKNLEKEQAIRTIALDIIAKEGLENLSMQKLAKAANVSPRTIYIKYEDKDDLLIKLFITEVLGAYEAATLKGFDERMDFKTGIKKLWDNGFQYLKNNRTHFALILYGKSSPMLNKAYQRENIQQGQFFAPIHRFIQVNVEAGIIQDLPFDAQRALMFSPLLDLVNEYFDHLNRPVQIITDEVIANCCDAVIKGMMK
ncbi:DNA-binding transcriptional regulator, AcrR family [Mucilaginibacter gossypiicola]|uniref:DNA-binding transcriptional regulator, AcrR family n=1 Tax=Mucilaginibacter gossypiicola TaxID=551995 RepID=A0A1H8TEA1_9SPHI|nr:TetR/AcrR family transcriptional regulator [Mucilaginibacter gossypiicola]SEO89430.1 DNA-binding transcriptional regulator, AcrR family [Mucilaginibacter gossypiicola]